VSKTFETFDIEYKYSFLVDIRNAWQTLRERRWLEENNLAYGMPSCKTMWRLFRNRPVGVSIKANRPVTCYWVSSGTWGSYEFPDRIYICPWHIEKAGGLERVMRHELLHLEHFNETVGMDYLARELYIDKKE
jgi:hypothetical protein